MSLRATKSCSIRKAFRARVGVSTMPAVVDKGLFSASDSDPLNEAKCYAAADDEDR